MNLKTKLLKVLILLMSILILQCGGDKGPKKLEIGVSVSNFDDVFLAYMRQAIKSKADEMGNITLSFEDSKDDIGRQFEHIENFINRGVDGMIVFPVDTKAAEKISKQAFENKVPLVYVNRNPGAHINQYKNLVSFVGSDEEYAGTVQMEGLAKAMGGKGNVVVMLGTFGHEGTRGRTKGVKKVAEQYPDINVIEEQSAKWQRKEALDLMNNWLSSGKEINAVAANNDEMAIGAINAIENAGKVPNKDIFVGGVDATQPALKMMEEGKLTLTVFQDAKGQAHTGVETLVKMVNKEEVDSQVWIPFLPVNNDNYKEFLNKNN